MDSFIDHGPIDSSVLTQHHDHRARFIWVDVEVASPLSFRRGASLSNVLAPRILSRLAECGFSGVHYIGRVQYDYGLLEALIERWRLETYTFHLPIEMTITLEDIDMISGLPIDGDFVTDVGYPVHLDWRGICHELLGAVPNPGDIDGSSLKLGWITSMFPHFHDLADDTALEIVDMYVRAYIMLALGSTAMPDRTNNKVKLFYLPLLGDVSRVSQYSWGSVSLSFLYRELCSATNPQKKQCEGFFNVLQIWAWERLRCVQPHIRSRFRDSDYVLMPLGCRWTQASLYLKEVTAHNLRGYHDQLAKLTDDQVVWQPYAERYGLPYYTQGQDVGWQRSLFYALRGSSGICRIML